MLKEKLVKGCVYRFKIAISIPKSSGFRINSIDIHFTPFQIKWLDAYEPILATATLSIPLTRIEKFSEWYVFEMNYTAKGNETSICIGNFKEDTRVNFKYIDSKKIISRRHFEEFAYVCIDGLELVKLENCEGENQIEFKNHSNISNQTNENYKSIKPEPIILDDLLFNSGSSKINSKEIPQIDSIVKFLTEKKDLIVFIEGHTDNLGSETLNIELSKNRAISVMNYLLNKGVDESRLKYNGFGSSIPIYENTTPEGRAKNRRVVIRFE